MSLPQILRQRHSIVTIAIIQGPSARVGMVGADLLTDLQRVARAAGQTLVVLTCSGLKELVATIRAIRQSQDNVMLLAPGDLAQQAEDHPEEGLDDALDELPRPYIEIHTDSDATLGRTHGPHRPAPATVCINGDLATSYRIALGIALRLEA
jgi:3-dehydroquinate dehydratase II